MGIRAGLLTVTCLGLGLTVENFTVSAQVPSITTGPYISDTVTTRAPRQVDDPRLASSSEHYRRVQQRLSRGWNTWDVHSVATQVLLPEGLAIHVGVKHNTSLDGDRFLRDALIGRLEPGAEQVTPGPHAWDGSYTDLRIDWKGQSWRIQSAHDVNDLVLLVSPLAATTTEKIPPTVVFSVNFLWNRMGTVVRHPDLQKPQHSNLNAMAHPDLKALKYPDPRQVNYPVLIETHSLLGGALVYCTCDAVGMNPVNQSIDIPADGPYFAADLTGPVGVGTGKLRTLAEIQSTIERQRAFYEQSIAGNGANAPIVDAIETTLGWDTIYDPDKNRVISPVSRLWSVNWGGYVLFDWDTFFAATMAGIGDRDLAYADAIETLREETPAGFVPNYARPGGWKSFDRSEPPVGSITVLGLYKKFGDMWFLEEAFAPLLSWNRWWSEHRDIQGYLAWGSDLGNEHVNADEASGGTRQGAIYESGLDNSPMYDDANYDAQSHLLEVADVGLMSMYVADCDALAEIADTLDKKDEAKELRDRSARYRAKLATLWDEKAGIFLNKDLHTGQVSKRLSPTNFYPMLAHAATPAEAKTMTEQHLLNPDEFWGQWVIPSIARNDAAFHDQQYWRGRIWGPMNYLVYLGLTYYDDAAVRTEFAQKSYSLFLREWTDKGHVHENYNAITGSGDDVSSSDRFYHWGALLGYVEYLEQQRTGEAAKPVK